MNIYSDITTYWTDFQTEASNYCFGIVQPIDFQYSFELQIPFSFTGKELDSETGYSYFGARYYDAELSGLFFSVDPMADKYPNISPYAYCAWNPVKLVDPDGNDGRVVVKQVNGRTSITISTTVYLKSTLLTKAQLANYAKNAQFEANKLLKSKYFENENCEVSFDVNYKVYNDEKMQPGDNLLIINPSKDETSGVKGTKVTLCGIVVGGLAGNVGEINSDICNSVGASKGRGIVHETMHFLGLLDRYSGNRSFKGFEKDIMGVDARIATLFDDSHYLSFIEKYKEVDMSGRPYILLIDRIDVMQTEQLKRVNVIEEL